MVTGHILCPFLYIIVERVKSGDFFFRIHQTAHLTICTISSKTLRFPSSPLPFLAHSAYRLKQPTILGYLVAGALIGPEIGLRFVTDPMSIETISELGLILLLFIIGLEMDLRELLVAGRQLLITAVGQFVLCAVLGFLTFSIFSGFFFGSGLVVLYLSLLCALSSTAVVVKLLLRQIRAGHPLRSYDFGSSGYSGSLGYPRSGLPAELFQSGFTADRRRTSQRNCSPRFCLPS